MPQKLSPVAAIKKFMEQDDKISPGGGKKIATAHFAGLTGDDRKELGAQAVTELNKAGGDFELEIQG